MGTSLVLLVLTVVSSPPQDPCTLLKPDEVQAPAPKDKLVPGKLDTTSASIGAISCNYEWGSGGNAATGRHYLHVIVMDAAKTFPGVPPDRIVQGMLAASKNSGSSPVPGIGESAMFESTSPLSARGAAYKKGSVLQVTFESSDARARMDQVIGLLKSAVARL